MLQYHLLLLQDALHASPVLLQEKNETTLTLFILFIAISVLNNSS